MVTRKPRKWRDERTRVLQAIGMSLAMKTRHNWTRVDLAKHIAEDIETLEYRNAVFIVTYKNSRERYVVAMNTMSIRQLEEFKRFIENDGLLIAPKATLVDQPFKGTERDSPMQKRKYVKRIKPVSITPTKVTKCVEITIERRGNHTKITMPKSMDNDTVCLVIE